MDETSNLIQQTKKDEFDNNPEPELDLKSAFSEISILFFPILIFLIFQFLFLAIAIVFVGNVYNNKDMINAMGIVFSVLNFTTIGIMFGINDTFEIIASNSYGAKKWITFNKVFYILRFIIFIFTLVMYVGNYFFVTGFINLLRESQAILYYAKRYIILMGIYPILLSQLFLLYNYLNIIERSVVNIFIQLIAIILHPVWCYVFISYLRLDVLGAAIAMICTTLLCNILVNIYIYFYPHEHIHLYAELVSFRGMKRIMIFAIPFIIVQWIECSGLELQAFIAVFLDKTSFAAYVIIFNIFHVFYSVIASLETMVIIIVSRYLTQFSTKRVKQMVYYIMLYSTIVSGFVLGIILILNFYLLRVYIKDPTVLAIGIKNFFIVPVGIFLYLYSCVLCTTLRSLGKPIFVCIVFVVIYMGIGMILSAVLGIYLELGLFGIYLTFIFALLVMIVIFGFALYNVDFEKARNEAFELIEEQNKTEEEISKEVNEVDNEKNKN